MARTKDEKRKKVATVMHEYKAGTLHSGSSDGPIVTNPQQAKAIAMSEAGMSKKKRKAKTSKSMPGVRMRRKRST